jgi:hypothetical protein
VDLIIIRFIGIILFFQTSTGGNPVKYTVLLPDGTPGITCTKCGDDLDEHKSFIAVIGREDGTDWPSSLTTKCGRDCYLYELDHDDLFITTVTESTIGVIKDPSVNRNLPRLKDFFKSGSIDLSLAKSKANATLELREGTLLGVEECNDMRTSTLVVKQGVTVPKNVTIRSRTHRDRTIIVPVGWTIGILNVLPKLATEKLATKNPIICEHFEHHEHDWFLHYELSEFKALLSDCHYPKSEYQRVLNKACSNTTYP